MIFKPSSCNPLGRAGGKPWVFACSFVAYFFALPVFCALRLQEYLHWQNGAESALAGQKIAGVLQELFGLANAPVLIVTAAGSLMAAWVYFAYLNDKKQVDFYHALPISRRKMFFRRSAAALLSLWSAYGLNLLLAAAVVYAMGMGSLWQWSAVWSGLAGHLTFSLALFFTAVLATELTGMHILSAALTLFFLGAGPSAIWSVRQLASCFYPSYYADFYNWQAPALWSSPLARYILAAGENQIPPADRLWIAGGIALLALAALLLHLRRPSEAAGRSIAFPLAEPLLKYPAALWTALILAMLLQEIGGQTLAGLPYGWLLFGALIGGVLACQVAEIIFQGDFKAGKSHLRGLAVFCLALVAVILMNIFDITGFNRFVPAPEQTAQVQIRFDGVNDYVYDGYYVTNMSYEYNTDASAQNIRREFAQGTLDTEEGIAAAISIQKKLIDAEQAQKIRERQGTAEDAAIEAEPYHSYTGCYLLYTLKDGRQIARKCVYAPIRLTDIAEELDVIFRSDSFLDGQYTLFQQAPQNLRLDDIASFADYRYNQWKNDPLFLKWRGRDLAPLLTAFEADIKSLTPDYMRQNAPVGSLSFRCYVQGIEDGASLEQLNGQTYAYYTYPLYPCFSQTLAALADLGYEDIIWQDRPEDIRRIVLYQTHEDGRETETVYDTSEEIERILDASVISDMLQFDPFIEVDYDRYYTVKHLDQDRYDTTRYGRLDPPDAGGSGNH
ncbi:MAG: DUF6449 domain-containing protein [Firmicutes bacterium]|nr:DUF6449 domain-containing protein [Bacillota bacterium]